ncbi:MAG: hypothetical protein N3C60_02900 [Calditerrivibrio sp.]|nr:hypothetical protein [Calditerrivibrio sp.]
MRDILLLYLGKSVDDKKELGVISFFLSTGSRSVAEEKIKSLLLKYYRSIYNDREVIEEPRHIFNNGSAVLNDEKFIRNIFITMEGGRIGEISFVKSIDGFCYNDVVEYIKHASHLKAKMFDAKFYILVVQNRSVKYTDDGFEIFSQMILKEELKILTVLDLLDSLRISLYEF